MKKKKILIGIGVTIGILLMISGSYAWWIITREQIGMNKLSTSCFELSLTKEKNEINLQNAYPIIDEEGKNLTPYSFTIKNTCDLFASYTISLELLEGSTLPSKYVAVMLNSEEIETLDQKERVEPIQKTSVERRVLGTGSLGSEDEEDYTLRIWLDEDVTMENKDAMNALLKGKIIIEGSPSTYSPVEQGITKLKDAILANEYQTTPEVAKEKISKKQTPDFSKTAPIIDWQENHGENTITVSYTLPHPDYVGQYDGFTNVNQSYARISSEYSFDRETGYYSLVDSTLLDPTTIDYSKGNYYIGSFGTNISSNDKISTYQNYQNLSILYKVNGVTTENTTITSASGTVFQTIKYQFTVNKYDQIELESDKSDKGLYEIEDDYGVSYYYRGSVKNNNVSFGGFNWQIIRINGDGSIRLLYNGTTPNATGSGKQIKISAFNTLKNHPGYVGYKYGNVSGATIEEVHANTNDSTIKTTLDEWYEKNIVEQNLSSYIADTGFCNDRTLSSSPNNGDGISTTKVTYYKARQRYDEKTPSLLCPNKERDLFTTSTSLVGNKALNNPVGLITVDEVIMAGMANGYLNRLTYAYSSANYWTLSPAAFNPTSSSATAYSVYSSGYVYGYSHVSFSYGVRPVINLSSETLISGGIGTSNDPFVIK